MTKFHFLVNCNLWALFASNEKKKLKRPHPNNCYLYYLINYLYIYLYLFIYFSFIYLLFINELKYVGVRRFRESPCNARLSDIFRCTMFSKLNRKDFEFFVNLKLLTIKLVKGPGCLVGPIRV